MEKQRNDVQNYYGKVLESKKDLKTTACCPAESLPKYIRPLASKVAPEIIEKFYGCGVPLPSALEGKTVLDLGCGTGRDAYILAQLVGPKGKVIGLDMTDEQLDTAKKYLPEHMERFGFDKPNVTFIKGFIEDLKSADIADNSVDLAVSNCVFNLSPDKPAVFSEVFRVLKPGGELFFSDVFSDRRLPNEFQEDDVLLGECLGGAIYIEDLRRLLNSVGCADHRTVSSSPIEVTDPEVQDKLGLTKFESRTVRAFKLDLEDRCEDYGQIATYLGTIENQKHGFQLDDHHLFVTGKPMPVCSNTAMMLTDTRFSQHFKVDGNTETHFGLFDCGPANIGAPSIKVNDQGIGCC